MYGSEVRTVQQTTALLAHTHAQPYLEIACCSNISIRLVASQLRNGAMSGAAAAPSLQEGLDRALRGTSHDTFSFAQASTHAALVVGARAACECSASLREQLQEYRDSTCEPSIAASVSQGTDGMAGGAIFLLKSVHTPYCIVHSSASECDGIGAFDLPCLVRETCCSAPCLSVLSCIQSRTHSAVCKRQRW